MLLALGLTDSSLHPGLILEVHEIVIALDCARLRDLALALVRTPTRERIPRVEKKPARPLARPLSETDTVPQRPSSWRSRLRNRP